MLPSRLADCQRPEKIELFLDRHAPQWRNNGTYHCKCRGPVAGEQQKHCQLAHTEVLASVNKCKTEREQHECKIQRPDPQNSTNIECFYIQISDLFLLAQQQFRYQESTETKEKINSKRSGIGYVRQCRRQVMGYIKINLPRHCVVYKHRQE